jgi:hypothetical protein
MQRAFVKGRRGACGTPFGRPDWEVRVLGWFLEEQNHQINMRRSRSEQQADIPRSQRRWLLDARWGRR